MLVLHIFFKKFFLLREDGVIFKFFLNFMKSEVLFEVIKLFVLTRSENCVLLLCDRKSRLLKPALSFLALERL